MSTHSVAEAKARLSALLDEVEAGGHVAITRRGRLVAQLVPAPSDAEFGWDALMAWAACGAPPNHRPPQEAELTVEAMREADLL